VDPACVLSLPEDATVAAGVDGELTLSGSTARVTLRRLTPALWDALHRLSAPGERAGRFAEVLRANEGPVALARWYYHLQRLADQGLLRFSTYDADECLATLEPIAPGFVLPAAAGLVARSYVLSRFAWTYRRGENLALESPLCRARIVLTGARAAALVHALARPATATQLAERVPSLPAEAVARLLGLLVDADMVTAVRDDGTTAEDADPALRCWEFHDLLFHARSREGRHDLLAGGTYRHAGRLEPPPALPAPIATEGIDLHRPDLDQLQSQDPPFARVQERRRSIRRYGAEPIGERQLGEFLYRVARVRERHEIAVETPAGAIRMDFAARPYPAGGSLYELEVYAAVHSCQGLDPGLYRYDPAGHRLERRAGRTADVERLLSSAANATGIAPDQMQVLLILAARVPRIAWKYSGIAYALILKDVGVVMQTMYLAATAMGLAPCAVGGGDSELFARAAGANYYSETSVGEFLLGSRMSAVTERG
jgi:oxazoline/thiazoline dehydrogenase